jgi:hypothetical protein
VNIINIKKNPSLLSARLSPPFPSLPQFSLSPLSNPNRRKRELRDDQHQEAEGSPSHLGKLHDGG